MFAPGPFNILNFLHEVFQNHKARIAPHSAAVFSKYKSAKSGNPWPSNIPSDKIVLRAQGLFSLVSPLCVSPVNASSIGEPLAELCDEIGCLMPNAEASLLS
jgi:hypothetical protein